MIDTTGNKKAGFIAATIVTLSVVILAVIIFGGYGKSTPPLLKEHLFVDATYLLKTGETPSTVNVTCTPYLTNIWETKSGNIKATVYVIESEKNLAVYKNTVAIGEIAGDSTGEIQIPVVLSNSSYKIEILIFENEKLVIKGSISISAYSYYIWDEVTHVQYQQWDVKNEGSSFVNIRSYP